MGYIQAIRDLGKISRRQDGTEKDGIDSFLQLPLPLVTDAAKSGREIRIWLDVTDKAATELNILGVSRVDLVEFPLVDKEKYLYRDPVGSNTTWKYSPIYKLGKGVTDGSKELLGKGCETERQVLLNWLRGEVSNLPTKLSKETKDNRYFKLRSSLLDAFEEEKTFGPGAVNIIMQHLIDKVEQISTLWADKKRSYILIFGINDGGQFLYPGEVPAFRNYFEKKLAHHLKAGSGEKQKGFCAICGNQATDMVTIDKLFTFATFDKPGFLPGTRDNRGVKEKVYPVCRNCFSLVSDGKEKINESFRDTQTVAGLFIDIIPEVIFDLDKLPKIASKAKDFLSKGIKTEEKIYNRLAEQGDGLVYHFLFWEKNQRQERVHLLVEDVPPSRLGKLLRTWQDVSKTHLTKKEDEKETTSLDALLKLLYRTLLHLAGKNDADKKIMRGKWLQITGELLGGQKVEAYWLKSLMVSRFPGLFADKEWVGKFAPSELKNMLALIDFLTIANER
ncbi:TM1802 family CRISPR-associated protein [Desulforamulus ferrireducens]|uniref:CRISPR-associated protein n=1 Tax=Desulforamulus ferrireducens TaxID=1833852 RepID=A0A1S6IUF1_9FIRM|nr:TM1802 family CRISPR-associated protein [Desulforamulus ferrireducens]AQS58401.1 hypothetical protein B0537_04430 [Desulforamulus ferrireducens]